MCRIAGIISGRLNPGEIKEKVRLMCAALKHGGPDDEGLFYDENAKLSFGHRRLSIIDLSKNGHQPMTDFSRRVWISFNGEIYNYLELKGQLEKIGYKFNTSTDTEVILAAYLQWGTVAFSKIQGMFAFVLFDKGNQLTYLVRDVTGIKPLYYSAVNDELCFASEIKAFKAARFANEADPEWSVRFLAFGHIPEPYTTLKNVFSLPAGNYLEWNHLKNNFKIVKYNFKNINSPLIKDVHSARKQINESLTAAVINQLLATDAPLGVFLSGGIDSSLISLIADEQIKEQLKTVSIFFNEKAYDERAYQNLILNRLSGQKFAHLVEQGDFEACFPRILNDMDMPTTDGINTWFISKYAHDDGLKAVLSGLGADELFGGYPSYNRIKYLKNLRNMPSWFFGLANSFKADKYRKISFLAHHHHLADYLLLRGLFVPSDIAQILDADLGEVNDILFNETTLKMDNYDEEHAAWFEKNIYMKNQLLRDTDVMSMSHGLEVRVPFLDETFQQVVESISMNVRFEQNPQKRLLIDSFSELLPEAIWNRPKMGFTFPLQKWMGQHPDVSNEHLYNGKKVRGFVKRFKQGRIHWSKLFALYQIQLHA